MVQTTRYRARVVGVLHKPQFWFGVIWLIPLLVWYAIFSFGPIIRAFPMAMMKYRIQDPANSPLVGLENFAAVMKDPMFFTSIWNTLLWTVLTFVFRVPLAMAISLCLVSVRRGRNLYQALVFLPVVVSLVAMSLLFKMLLDPDIGQINRILWALGLPGSRFLASSRTVLPTAVGILTWKSVGFQVVLLTAGLLAIPESLYDAAVVDGVNPWQRFWLITLPLVADTVLLITVLLAIGALQEFTLPYILTGGEGGASKALYLYNTLIYSEAFGALQFGRASALALMQFAVILAATVLQIRLLRPQWSY
ncbi:MAG: carbohydrate ABC transporter permease [Anaerolineae bacterium]